MMFIFAQNLSFVDRGFGLVASSPLNLGYGEVILHSWPSTRPQIEGCRIHMN
jgi:hypothetical protein